ncbi:uncharacterized protein LOC106178393 isoform X1 [Lingula anatina]|uniref:Uncharacterized protein LOC106178393 isoform X1 n=1 Tax=Lingula anatina TaxID=7574 RepID=A0A1S3K417_LINAN|nr:uncharacterized protein LOC106178393 isoform X1 [Lingula anatina]|eukprot:XP_013417001.1 uncharacterized protein LOC106178393 isoform X1 [Lingula anatina]
MKQLLTIALLICAQLVKGQDVKARGLFDSLEFLKCGTKPGPALDLVKAFRATGRVVNELKSIVPGLQNHIRGGIEDVATSLHDVINAIANDVKSDCKEEVRKGRGLFDTLESLTSGTQLGTALKVINAVGMTQRFLSELKQLVPDIQKHLNGSIDDITTALHNIVNSITDEVLSGGNVGDRKGRGLFDSLESLTSGTQLGTALKVINAVGMTQRFLSELKQLVPDIQKHLNGSIDDITTALHNIVNSITDEVLSGGNVGDRKGRGLFDSLESLTSGTQLGTALKVINAVGMTQRFLSELKQLVPDIQKHLNGSIDDITTALHNIVNSITDEVLSGGNVGDRKGRGLFDTLESLTSGTQLGTALKVINAVGMTQRFLSELKQLVPDIQKHLNGSIDDITTALHNIVNSITDEVLSGGNVGDRKGRDIFDMETALNLIKDVENTKRFVNEINDIVPGLGERLKKTLEEISSALHAKVSLVTEEIMAALQ